MLPGTSCRGFWRVIMPAKKPLAVAETKTIYNTSPQDFSRGLVL